MSEHYTSTVFTEEEAIQRLVALNAEITEIVRRYGLHSFMFIASALTPPTPQSM